MNVGKRLKHLRKINRKTMAVVVRELEIPYALYAKWEMGTELPGRDVLAGFAEYYQVSLDYILGKRKYCYRVEDYEFTEFELDFFSKFKRLSSGNARIVRNLMDNFIELQKMQGNIKKSEKDTIDRLEEYFNAPEE